MIQLRHLFRYSLIVAAFAAYPATAVASANSASTTRSEPVVVASGQAAPAPVATAGSCAVAYSVHVVSVSGTLAGGAIRLALWDLSWCANSAHTSIPSTGVASAQASAVTGIAVSNASGQVAASGPTGAYQQHYSAHAEYCVQFNSFCYPSTTMHLTATFDAKGFYSVSRSYS